MNERWTTGTGPGYREGDNRERGLRKERVVSVKKSGRIKLIGDESLDAVRNWLDGWQKVDSCQGFWKEGQAQIKMKDKTGECGGI